MVTTLLSLRAYRTSFIPTLRSPWIMKEHFTRGIAGIWKRGVLSSLSTATLGLVEFFSLSLSRISNRLGLRWSVKISSSLVMVLSAPFFGPRHQIMLRRPTTFRPRTYCLHVRRPYLKLSTRPTQIGKSGLILITKRKGGSSDMKYLNAFPRSNI